MGCLPYRGRERGIFRRETFTHECLRQSVEIAHPLEHEREPFGRHGDVAPRRC